MLSPTTLYFTLPACMQIVNKNILADFNYVLQRIYQMNLSEITLK